MQYSASTQGIQRGWDIIVSRWAVMLIFMQEAGIQQDAATGGGLTDNSELRKSHAALHSAAMLLKVEKQSSFQSKSRADYVDQPEANKTFFMVDAVRLDLRNLAQ